MPQRRHLELVFRVAPILLSLLLLEGALRVLGLPAADGCWAPKESYWVPDDALGFAYQPGAHVAGGVVNAISFAASLRCSLLMSG